MRFYMFEAAIQGYSQHPILGVGLNNSTAAMKAGRQELKDMGIPAATNEPADSYYLAILTEIGPIGSILFFGFFGKIVAIGLRSTREVAVEMKPLLVGMIAGFSGAGYPVYRRWAVGGPRCQRYIMAFRRPHCRHTSL